MHKLFQFLIGLWFGFTILFCSPQTTSKDRVDAMVKNNKEPLEVFAGSLLREILGNQLKSFELGTNKSNEKELHLYYGGNSALSFHDQSEYRDQTLSFHSLVQLRVVYGFLSFGIPEFSFSLYKPFYIKGETNPDVEVQDFEVLRTTIPRITVQNILEEHPQFDPFVNPKQNSQDWETINKKIQSQWKLELDELYRVSLE
ncbi:hypothetical protein P3G55_01150 [Leptospira sp. 96542]|nr:hypothetical protein [Leptospira sp. 96542]